MGTAAVEVVHLFLRNCIGSRKSGQTTHLTTHYSQDSNYPTHTPNTVSSEQHHCILVVELGIPKPKLQRAHDSYKQCQTSSRSTAYKNNEGIH